MIINSTWSKPLLVSFFFNLLSTSLLAQSFFTSGYIVTQQGDTLSGEIQQEGNGRILFRNGKETSQPYTATQLKAYVIEGVPSIPVSWKVEVLPIIWTVKGHFIMKCLLHARGYDLILPPKSLA